ncbi:unnamed protein product [Closterium sp. NIES-64]|nr:unnamed protein product [Closterium sp. NIES-64]
MRGRSDSDSEREEDFRRRRGRKERNDSPDSIDGDSSGSDEDVRDEGRGKGKRNARGAGADGRKDERKSRGEPESPVEDDGGRRGAGKQGRGGGDGGPGNARRRGRHDSDDESDEDRGGSDGGKGGGRGGGRGGKGKAREDFEEERTETKKRVGGRRGERDREEDEEEEEGGERWEMGGGRERVRVGRKEKRGEEGRRGGRAESEEREERDKGEGRRERDQMRARDGLGEGERERDVIRGREGGRGRGRDDVDGRRREREDDGGRDRRRDGEMERERERDGRRGRDRSGRHRQGGSDSDGSESSGEWERERERERGGIRGRGREDRHRRHAEGRREEGRRDRGRGEWEGEERRGDGRGAPVRAPNADAAATPAPAAAATAGGAVGPGAGPAAGKASAARDTGRTGGAYIPPFKLARMLQEVNDRSSAEYQRLTWDALRKSINGLVNKVNASNIKNIIPELFAENLVRGRGLLCRACIKSQMASPTFTHVFAALVAVVNTKFPELGELLLKRIILQFRRAFRRNDKMASPIFTHVFAALVAVVNTMFPELGELLLKRIILQFRRAFRRNDKVRGEGTNWSRFSVHRISVARDFVGWEPVVCGAGGSGEYQFRGAGRAAAEEDHQAAFRRNDKVRGEGERWSLPKLGESVAQALVALVALVDVRPVLVAACRFLAHLCNQQVAHEIVALELLTLLLETPTDDSVEVRAGEGGIWTSAFFRFLSHPHPSTHTSALSTVNHSQSLLTTPHQPGGSELREGVRRRAARPPSLSPPPISSTLNHTHVHPFHSRRLPITPNQVAVSFVKECGAMLQDLSPQGLHSIFERFRGILHEGEIDKRVQFTIEGLFAIRKAKFELTIEGLFAIRKAKFELTIEGLFAIRNAKFEGFPARLPELDLIEEEGQISSQFLPLLTSCTPLPVPPSHVSYPLHGFPAGFPAVLPELDLVEEEDQITHELSLEEPYDPETSLDVFKFDPDYLANKQRYKEIKAEILGDEEEDEDEKGEGGGDDDDDDEDEESSEEEEDEEEQAKQQEIRDETETNLVNLRRTIYLTIMASVNFEEAGHKLMKVNLQPGQEMELCEMLLACCSQERTYLRYYGLLGQRFCMLNRAYQECFEQCFVKQYSMIHRLETNKLRNVAKLFAHFLATDAMPWALLSYIRLTEEDTSSSSRIFIKIMFQQEMSEQLGLRKMNETLSNVCFEMSEQLGLRKMNERLSDPTMGAAFDGIFPKDTPKNTRFAINFFTSIGLGGLTDNLREHLKNMPKLIMQQQKPVQVSEKSAADSRDQGEPRGPAVTLASVSRDDYAHTSRSASRSPLPHEQVQGLLDQNPLLIHEIKANHEARQLSWLLCRPTYDVVQGLLDQNRLLIHEIKANHEARLPDGLMRNVTLIRELNSNVTKVVDIRPPPIYADISHSFPRTFGISTAAPHECFLTYHFPARSTCCSAFSLRAPSAGGRSLPHIHAHLWQLFCALTYPSVVDLYADIPRTFVRTFGSSAASRYVRSLTDPFPLPRVVPPTHPLCLLRPVCVHPPQVVDLYAHIFSTFVRTFGSVVDLYADISRTFVRTFGSSAAARASPGAAGGDAAAAGASVPLLPLLMLEGLQAAAVT